MNTEWLDSLTTAAIFTPSVIMSDIFFGIGLVVTSILCWNYNSDKNNSRQSNFLLTFLGLLVGWIIATLAIPFNPVDRQLYSGIGTALGAFFSGYLISKLDGVWSLVIFKSPDKTSLNIESLQFLAFFVTGMALSSSVIVVNRTEWLSIAFQCNPTLYGADLKKDSFILADKALCDKLRLPMPKETQLSKQ
ncbi:hypothetical protein [Pseudomonas mohnii]